MPNQFIYHPDPNEVIRINNEPMRRLAGRLYKSAPGHLRGRNPETGDQEADTEEGGLLSAPDIDDIDDTDDDETSLPGDQTEAETVAPAEPSPEKAAASKVSPTRQRAMTFFEELVYAGQRGLSDAQRTYNPAQGASFHTHATRRVCGAMLDFIKEESGGAVRVSRGTRRFINEIHEAQNQLRHDLSREPEIDEVTKYLKQSREMSVEQVAQVLDARKQALSEGAAKLEELAKKIADRSGIPFAQVKRVLLTYNDIVRKNPANATPEKIADRLIVTQEKVTLGFTLMTTRYEVIEPPDSDEDQDDWRGGWGVASAELSPEETFLREEFVRALEAAIRSLPNELQRKVCYLKLFEGLDPGEIAERLSLSKDALKTPARYASRSTFSLSCPSALRGRKGFHSLTPDLAGKRITTGEIFLRHRRTEVAASVFNLHGSGGPDNELAKRTRGALQSSSASQSNLRFRACRRPLSPVILEVGD